MIMKPFTGAGAGVEPMIGKWISDGGVAVVVKRLGKRKIGLCFGSPEVSGGGVVCTRRLLGGVKGS